MNIKEYVKQEKESARRSGLRGIKLGIIDGTKPDDAANQIYMRNKVKDFEELGWEAQVYKVPEDISFVKEIIARALDDGCTSVIVQLPLREGLIFEPSDIPLWADCDGLRKDSPFIPATPRGIVDYLDYCGFDLEEKSAVVIGRSEIVGKPLALELLKRNATVTICHSKTPVEVRDRLLKDADLVVVATGVAGLIKRAQCPKAFVVDVGINRIRLPDGKSKLVGDFEEDPEVESPGSTPVPGGVGLLTRLALIKNAMEWEKGKEGKWSFAPWPEEGKG